MQISLKKDKKKKEIRLLVSKGCVIILNIQFFKNMELTTCYKGEEDIFGLSK